MEDGKVEFHSKTIHTVSWSGTCTPYVSPQCWTKATANGNINSDILILTIYLQ